ncbi:MAG: hypothetical protein HZA48_07930 [Planctomycetes bacterium]|nr:hypothetical protein [Planctomycetota bacterium]
MKNKKSPAYKSIIEIDSKQWGDWRHLTPAQRWDECARIWMETYEVRKKSKAHIRQSIQRSFGRSGAM